MITRGFPGTKRSTRAKAQQAICTMRRAAMQNRKEVSLDMLEECLNGMYRKKIGVRRKTCSCSEVIEWLVCSKVTASGA